MKHLWGVNVLWWLFRNVSRKLLLGRPSSIWVVFLALMNNLIWVLNCLLTSVYIFYSDIESIYCILHTFIIILKAMEMKNTPRSLWALRKLHSQSHRLYATENEVFLVVMATFISTRQAILYYISSLWMSNTNS